MKQFLTFEQLQDHNERKAKQNQKIINTWKHNTKTIVNEKKSKTFTLAFVTLVARRGKKMKKRWRKKKQRRKGARRKRDKNKINTTKKQRNKKGEGKSPMQLSHERSNYQEPSLWRSSSHKHLHHEEEPTTKIHWITTKRKKKIERDEKKRNKKSRKKTKHNAQRFELCYLQAIKKTHNNFLLWGWWRRKKIESKRKT